jgi:hypothetical protein
MFYLKPYGVLVPFCTFATPAQPLYNVAISEVRHMVKIWVSLNEAEWRLLLHAMNKLRTSLISEGRYTDVVDEVIMKIANAPIKRVKQTKAA